MGGAAEFRDEPTGLDLPALDGRLRDLVDYWRRLRGPDRAAPSRHDLNPADVQPLLPWIMLLDVADGDYRYRLVGTGLDGLFGRPLTGSTLRQAWPQRLGQLWHQWMDRAAQEIQPVATSATLATRRGKLRLDQVFLPVSNHPDRIDMLLCGTSGTCLRRQTTPLPRPADELHEEELVAFAGGMLTV